MLDLSIAVFCCLVLSNRKYNLYRSDSLLPSMNQPPELVETII